LLRGLIWNGAWTQVKTSALRQKSSDQNFRTSLMDTVRSIERAYWDLIAKNEDERVARKSLETAAALLEQSQTEYEVGVKSKVDVYEAEAGKAEREFELIRSENLALNAQDTLIDRVLGTKLTAGSLLEIEPTDDPDNVIEYKIDVEHATKEAFRRRPELAARRLAVEESEIQLKFAKNQRLPQLDIIGTIGTSGKDGSAFNSPFAVSADQALATDIDPNTGMFDLTTTPIGLTANTPIRTNGYSDTSSQLFRSTGGNSHSVRAVLTIPLGMISGRHGVSKSQLVLRQSVTELRRQEQSIIVEIRRAARNLESAQRGIVSSEQRRVAAQEQLRAEDIRLEHGESTPFDVLQRERDLVEAERQKILALQLYRNSITDLHRFQGTILNVHHISISDAERLR
jgi:outer membrane protein TolC